MFQTLRKVALLLLASVGLMLATAAQADPPYRVARLSVVQGDVSFSPGSEPEWSRAVINRPLINGDQLWVAEQSRAELQLGATAIRVGDQSSLAVLNVDNRIAQLQLTQGDMEVRVWRMDPNQVVEIDTPNLAVVIRQPGSYRIEVDSQDSSTAVTVRAGNALLYGEGRAFRIGPTDTWRFYDTRLADYDTYRSRSDELARWSAQRDRRWQNSVSARYVSRDMIGFADLDENGTWQQVPPYGWVWSPTRVAAEWAPYRDGHWSWVEPWGWTWVDDQPWGFAPSHYGRWAYASTRWVWVPGPVKERPVYAPALVAFVGGAALGAAVSSNNVIGWFPLAPREVYRPSYQASREYLTRVNVSNTLVTTTQVTNVYNTRNVTNVYLNQRVPNAIVAVPTQAFVQARPIAREVVRVQVQNVQPQAIVLAPQVAPGRSSVMGAQPAQHKPPEQVMRRQVVAQTAPPPPAPRVETRAAQIQANSGQPVAPPASAPARTQGNAPAGAAPSVKVVQPTQPAASAPPPPKADAKKAEREQRREQRDQQRDERDKKGPRAESAASPPAASAPAPSASANAARPAAPAAASSAPASRPATPAAASAPAPAARPAAPPAASAPAPAAPAAASAQERGRGEERGRGDDRQRGRPDLGRPGAANAPASSPAAAAPAATPPATTPPAGTAPAATPSPRAAEAASARDQRSQQREERREQNAPATAPAPAARPSAPAPAAPQAAPAPAPASQPAARDQRQQQREERQQQRGEAAAPAQRPSAPAQPPAQAAPAPAQRPAPAQPPTQATPAPAPTPTPAQPQAPAATARPASPPASAAEQRRERASARAEERKEAASERERERGRKP